MGVDRSALRTCIRSNKIAAITNSCSSSGSSGSSSSSSKDKSSKNKSSIKDKAPKLSKKEAKVRVRLLEMNSSVRATNRFSEVPRSSKLRC